MQPNELLDQICDVLIEHEGLVPWLYCDSRGFVTIGVGDKVTAQNVLTLPFFHTTNGRLADPDEKLTAFICVQNFFHKGISAKGYYALSDLCLDAEFCRRRLAYRVKNEFIPAVTAHCQQFSLFPRQAKLVLVDIAYNVGIAGFAAFVELIASCNARDFEMAASQVHTARDGEDPKRPDTWGRRNSWRRNTMLAAKAML